MAGNSSGLGGLNTTSAPTLVLLPGLDGTGRLFDRFEEAVRSKFRVSGISYATNGCESYRDLERMVRKKLDSIDGPVVLVAESFSGPVAVRVAAQNPANLVGVVLVATFLSPPKPAWMRWLVNRVCLSVPMPAILVRTFLLDFKADPALVSAVREAIGRVRPSVLAFRIREILSVDVEADVASGRVPFLFLEAQRDRLVRANRRQWEQAIPDLRWAEIDGPHLLLQSAPHRAASVIGEFVCGVVDG